MYQRQCEKCGAYLDPAERCDCVEEKTISKENQNNIIKFIAGADNQIRFAIGGDK